MAMKYCGQFFQEKTKSLVENLGGLLNLNRLTAGQTCHVLDPEKL
jgi:hypothetical protein